MCVFMKKKIVIKKQPCGCLCFGAEGGGLEPPWGCPRRILSFLYGVLVGVETYRQKCYPEEWIAQRMMTKRMINKLSSTKKFSSAIFFDGC